MKARICIALLAMLSCIPLGIEAATQDLRPFVSGSYAQVVQSHAGQPFILSMWSVTCAPCREELTLFSEMLKKHPNLQLILVSTDSPSDASALRDTLTRHGIERAEIWVFAEPAPEKLRLEIDRRWYGELPRTYLFQANGKAEAKTGKLSTQTLESWLAVNQ